MEYQKVKSVPKVVETRGANLDSVILKTLRICSEAVGGTLGPGGRQVLIERQEYDLPPLLTKDGVTVFRALGFNDPVMQCVMEVARNGSVRTASEAGDGTTTATILTESIVRKAMQYTESHPRVSPQRIVRKLEKAFRDHVEPLVKRLSVKADMSTQEGRRLLEQVATISANGDVDLAKAVMECYDLVGDDGNVTIAEVNGPSHYEVERIEGFPIPIGFEESAGKFYNKFINDAGNQRTVMEKATFVLYHGRILDEQSLFGMLRKLGFAFEHGKIGPNVVLVATGFSERVLGYLAMMFPEAGALNVFPLLAPQSPFANGQADFLMDLAAITGAAILDQLNVPLEEAQDIHFGYAELFESSRFRSNVVGRPNQDTVLLRVDELQANLARAESQLDEIYLKERIGKLTGGIARLKVVGAGNGELKEKRDRADDAVCAVRGAIKHGCVPGGAWTLLKIAGELNKLGDPILSGVLVPALFDPFQRLLDNVGITPRNDDEIRRILEPILDSVKNDKRAMVYDCLEGRVVDAFDAGILDSTPAVLEAVRSSLSNASLLGTMGAAVVFARDLEVERTEARDRTNYEREMKNEANERY